MYSPVFPDKSTASSSRSCPSHILSLCFGAKAQKLPLVIPLVPSVDTSLPTNPPCFFFWHCDIICDVLSIILRDLSHKHPSGYKSMYYKTSSYITECKPYQIPFFHLDMDFLCSINNRPVIKFSIIFRQFCH